MAIDPNLRMKIEAELRLGKKARELSEKYEVPYVTVNKWRKTITAQQADADIDDLMQYDEVTLHHMAEELKKTGAPLPAQKQVEKAVGDVIGLSRLEEKTRTTAFSILNKVEAALQVMSEPNLKELGQAANIVSTLHTALFNKNTTQVNVLNNNTTNISAEKREIFKSSLKA